MALREMKRFFDKSLRGLVRGQVRIGEIEYPYDQWDGERLASKLISLDTETEVVEERNRVPRLAVAQVYDGNTAYLIHPRRLGEFLVKHSDCSFACHNVAFDFFVVYKHLLRSKDRKAARLWLNAADDGRITDTMLQDQLIRIAFGSKNPVQRNLAALADHRLGISDVNKNDPWRMRYAEIIGVDWKTVPREAWEYAVVDAVVTRKIFLVQRDELRDLVHTHAIPRDVAKKFGPLTLRVQVRAAIALRQIEINGIHLDTTRRDSSQDDLQDQVGMLVAELDSMEDFHGVFKRDKNGNLLVTNTGKPRTNQKRLRQVLNDVAEDHELTPPRTKTGEVSLTKEFWQEHVDSEPFIDLWLVMEEKAKLLQFFGSLQSHWIFPGYTTLVRTGRTSCKKPNIQQIPKAGTFREMFVPRQGCVFLIIDYSSLELRTLASVCEERFGYSVLADTIRSGRDPHCYVASILSDMNYEEFVSLKDSDEDTYKSRRQSAKVCSFGIPGGLGPSALVQYARINYGVTMSEDEAEEFRQRFLEDIFPEIGEYMKSDSMHVLAENLKCKVWQVQRHFQNDGVLGAAKRIVSGKPYKQADKEPYADKFVSRIWESLRKLNKNTKLVQELQDEVGSESLERKLFFGSVVAPGGFIRGRVTFTQARNTPFQSAASTGGKIAAWELFRAGYRVAAFIHDEFVIELDESSDLDKHASRIDAILCDSMQQVTGKVPVETEYAIASCWSKQAELIRNDSGTIQIWHPQRTEKSKAVAKVVEEPKQKTKTDGISAPAVSKVAKPTETPTRPVKKRKGKPATPLKWFGGKAYLADWILGLMPKHTHYVELFFGGGQVLFRKDPVGISEVANDLNGELVNFYRVLRNPATFDTFARAVDLMPFSETEFKASLDSDGNQSEVDRAVMFFVRYRQSRTGLGKCFATTSRTRTRRNMNEQVSSWLGAIEGLEEAHERLSRVVFMDRRAVEVIKSEDGTATVFYADPPYLHETRVSKDAYEFEMSKDDHSELLETLRNIKGKFLLSGYHSKLYDDFAQANGWICHERAIDNKASSKSTKDKKIECIWTNYDG